MHDNASDHELGGLSDAITEQDEELDVEVEGVQHVVTVSGFERRTANGVYEEETGSNMRVGGRPTYWNENDFFLYYCKRYNQWRILTGGSWGSDAVSKCYAVATGGSGSLPSGKGWNEWMDNKWTKMPEAGVDSIGQACSSYTSEATCESAPEGCQYTSQCTAKWQLWGSAGPEFSDVRQGELGTCYFLAAIASVAYKHPEAISSMFVPGPSIPDEHYPVHIVRLHLVGQPIYVAVDELFPVSRSAHPVFVGFYSSALHLWPMLLEKAWAKVFGTFKSVEAGHGPEAFKAIAQSPVDVVLHHTQHIERGITTVEEVWSALQEAMKMEYPVWSASESDVVGIAKGHAYGVLDVKTEGGKRYVRVYNPWSVNRYRGKVQGNENDEGDFWMLFDEFIPSFTYSAIAKIKTGYMNSYEVLAKGQTKSLSKSLSIEMKKDDPFSVHLEWPNYRLSDTGGCASLTPTVKLRVTKEGGSSVTATMTAERRWVSFANVRADLPGGSGRYTIDVSIYFPSGKWVDEVVVNTYATELVEFTDPSEHTSSGAAAPVVSLSSFRTNVLNGKYAERSDRRVGHRESYWSDNGYYLYFCQHHNLWMVDHQSNFDRSAQGQCSAAAYSPSSSLDPKKSSSPRGWYEAVNGQWSYTSGAAMSVSSSGSLAEGAFESAVNEVDENGNPTCAAIIDRLDTLNNAAEIIRSQSDSLFPAALSSIARPGQKCGDTARLEQAGCDKYNRWMSLSQIMGAAHR